MRFNGIYWDLLKLTGWFHTPEKYSPMGCSDIHHLPIPTPKHSSQLRAFCRVFLTSSSGSQKTTQHQWLFPLHHFWIRSYCRANLGFKLHLALFFHKIPRKKKDLRISSWSENLPIQMAQDSSCIKLHQLLCLLCLMLKPTRCLNHHPCYGGICMYAYINIYIYISYPHSTSKKDIKTPIYHYIIHWDATHFGIHQPLPALLPPCWGLLWV